MSEDGESISGCSRGNAQNWSSTMAMNKIDPENTLQHAATHCTKAESK
jgi:hypothetical protein